MTHRFLADRRRILTQLGVIAGGLAVGVPVRSGALPAKNESHPELADAVSRLIRHPSSAAVIGESYLREFRDERSAARLWASILDRLPATDGPLDEGMLLGAIRADFEREDVVNLQGWFLSRTEAQMCALYAV